MNIYPENMRNRKEFLKEELAKRNIDILLVYSSSEDFGLDLALNNIKPILFHYYFLNKNGHEGFLEIDCIVENLKKQFKGEIIAFDERSPEKIISKFLEKYARVAIAGNAPWAHLAKTNKEIIDFNQEAGIILRQKETNEVDKIEKAAKIASQILKKAEKSIKANRTQREIENLLRKDFLKVADKLAFPICITSGKDIENTTAMMPLDKKILKKDIVCIDAGIVKEGFYSDCTRMFFINNPQAKKDYQRLLKAHHNAIKRIKEGVSIKEIVSIYEQELKKQKLPAETLEKKDLGHSIGFKLHEDPIFFKEGQEENLKENMIITLEPEIKIKNYKLRIEDMILIKKKESKILTK
jgi:methionyl aminopeptidase